MVPITAPLPVNSTVLIFLQEEKELVSRTTSSPVMVSDVNDEQLKNEYCPKYFKVSGTSKEDILQYENDFEPTDSTEPRLMEVNDGQL